MKFLVLKKLTRRAEGMKTYNPGDSIELTKEESRDLLEFGFIKAKAKPKAKKDESNSK